MSQILLHLINLESLLLPLLSCNDRRFTLLQLIEQLFISFGNNQSFLSLLHAVEAIRNFTWSIGWIGRSTSSLSRYRGGVGGFFRGNLSWSSKNFVNSINELAVTKFNLLLFILTRHFSLRHHHAVLHFLGWFVIDSWLYACQTLSHTFILIVIPETKGETHIVRFDMKKVVKHDYLLKSNNLVPWIFVHWISIHNLWIFANIIYIQILRFLNITDL